MDHGLPYGLSTKMLGLQKTRPPPRFPIPDPQGVKWFSDENIFIKEPAEVRNRTRTSTEIHNRQSETDVCQKKVLLFSNRDLIMVIDPDNLLACGTEIADISDDLIRKHLARTDERNPRRIGNDSRGTDSAGT